MITSLLNYDNAPGITEQEGKGKTVEAGKSLKITHSEEMQSAID